MPRIRRALISVSDKRGLGAFVSGLRALDIEIISTGGTFSFLQQSGSTREIEDAGVRIVAHNKDNTGIRQLAILNRIQYRFEVRSPSRPEHRNLEHAVIVAQF